MKKIISFFLTGTALSLFGQVQAVYDGTVHQQMVLCHNAKIQSDNMTREWLSTILSQMQVGQNTFVNSHKELYEKLKEINDRVGDPSNINLNMTNFVPGQNYGNKRLQEIRQSAFDSALNGGNADADKLFGDNAEKGRAEMVVEQAYLNYESVLMKIEEDRSMLLQKREALIAVLPQLTNMAQLKKIQIALEAVDSKLKSIAETEKNAALKVLVLKARNEEQRKKKEQIQEAAEIQMQINAHNAMTNQAVQGMHDALQELKQGLKQ